MMRTVITSTMLLGVAAEVAQRPRDDAVGRRRTGLLPERAFQYFCKHLEDKYSHYINCDECVAEPICCDVSEATVGYRPNGGGKRCTEKAHGVVDVSNCASLAYPEACPGGDTDETPAVGSQDENGCYSSAGYQWCATESACMRLWEQADKMDANGDGRVSGEEFEAHCTESETNEGKCECENPPCSEAMCLIECEYGILVDEDGCVTCTCAEAPVDPEPETPVDPEPETPVDPEPEVCEPGKQEEHMVCSNLWRLGKFTSVELCAAAVMEQCDYVDNFNYRPRNGACLCSNDKCASKANSKDIDIWGCGYAQQFAPGVRSASGKQIQKGSNPIENKEFPIALAIGVGATALVAIIAASIMVYKHQQSKKGLHVLQNKADDINDTTVVAEDEELVGPEEGTAVVVNC